MKIAVALLLLVGAISLVSANDFFKTRGHRFSFGNSGRSSGSGGRSSGSSRRSGSSSSSSRSSSRTSFRSQGSDDGQLVDKQQGGSDYHYSWKHAGSHKKWSHSGANNYCSKLTGGGWAGISINSQQEDDLVKSALSRGNIPYIWTSGKKSGRSWKWVSGGFQGFGWSHTGFHKKPQPDNRDGNEDCLAVLNRFYDNDGITWHDVGCTHKKPIICERKSK